MRCSHTGIYAALYFANINQAIQTMPELPEVETTLRGIRPYIEHQIIHDVIIRHYGLRWPIPIDIAQKITHQKIQQLQRRAKYLLLRFDNGTVIIHLGMSGSLRILKEKIPPKKHEHFDIEFAHNITLRFTDPRRFGMFLWTEQDPNLHPLLRHLGYEPFDKYLTGRYLWELARTRKIAIKTFIMDQKIVVGVGNIYANEALFSAGIHPQVSVNNVNLERFNKLVAKFKAILRKSIIQGGTTLKDFVNGEGKPGYFSQQLKVYGRQGLPCYQCQTILKMVRINQRSTVFCEQCQK